MNEFGTTGVKADTAVFVRAVGSILQVAFDRASHLCQLATYLVMTSGLQIDLK